MGWCVNHRTGRFDGADAVFSHLLPSQTQVLAQEGAVTEAADCDADLAWQCLSNHGTDGDRLLHMQVSLSGGGAICKDWTAANSSPLPPLLQVDAVATPMLSDSDAAGPAAGAQGRTGVGGLSGHAGASPAAGSGRSRSRSASKSGSESGGDSDERGCGGASSGDEGSSGG